MSKPSVLEKAPAIRVFYNSACPICNAGIKHQRSKTSDVEVSYEDVHLDHTLLAHLNVPINAVRERLHVIDEHHRVQVGIDAFIAIWHHSEGEQWKARFLSLPGIHGVASILYNILARCLFSWNQWKKRW